MLSVLRKLLTVNQLEFTGLTGLRGPLGLGPNLVFPMSITWIGVDSLTWWMLRGTAEDDFWLFLIV
jgi:hypothetical protein